jgi:predicted transcriptional regulator
MIVTNPGVHYSALKEELELPNGVAAYHLNMLERKSVIRSARDGKLKRFYQVHQKTPEDVGMSPEGTRDAIVELVRKRPGISQLEVMEELGLERNEASYYLRAMVKEGRLNAGKEGRFTVYTVNGAT